MSLALHFSPTRSRVRQIFCEAEEGYIERRFSAHNENCIDEDSCPLHLLENVVVRAVQADIVDEDATIVLLSTFDEPEK
jgi:hypothetical protein